MRLQAMAGQTPLFLHKLSLLLPPSISLSSTIV
jgi:hypothetical protein